MSQPSGQSVPVATARTATLLAFAVNGVNFASWASRIPEVKQKLDLSAGDLGTVLLAVSVGSLIALSLSGRIAQALGVSRALFANDWLRSPSWRATGCRTGAGCWPWPSSSPP